MRFLAEEQRLDGHWYSVDFDATDWCAAEAICLQEGWTLKGEIHHVIPAGPLFGKDDADRLIANLNAKEEKR